MPTATSTPDKKAPHGGRFSVYSWDLDTAFQKQACQPKSCDPFVSVAGWYIPPGVRSKFVLRLQRVFHAELCKAMDEFLTKAYLPELIDSIAAPLTSVMNDPRLASDTWPIRVPATCPADASDGTACSGRVPLPVAEWQAAVKELRDFIVSNKVRMTAAVAAGCAVSPGLTDGGAMDGGKIDAQSGEVGWTADVQLSTDGQPDVPVSTAFDGPASIDLASDDSSAETF